MTIRERSIKEQKEQKEKALALTILLVTFNDRINYFDKKTKNCYVDMLSFVASGNKARFFTSTDYKPYMIEEVLENTTAYFDSKKYKHSELYYFEQEVSRKGLN
jgi:hypothetical protein